MKKWLAILLAGVMCFGLLAGCSSSSESDDDTEAEEAAEDEEEEEEEEEAEESDFDSSAAIEVISREDGSGTRSAFVELTGVESDDVDNTTVEAVITNSTAVMLTTVSGSDYAIGYVSMGSMNDTVKAVSIEGVEATTENVGNGSYSISRPFNIVTGDDLSDAAQDFINYILSDEGQAVIEEEGYISIGSEGAYESNGASGTVSVSGSTSVSPVMEKLKEAYEEINGDVTVEIMTSDSSTGISDAISGTSDIGMASRDLKDSETGVTATTIAMDGIAVIVNNNNTVDDLTLEQVAAIFTGEYTTWDEVIE